MARNDNLTDLLRDVAVAIREKTNSASLINPQDFPERIAAIKTAGGQPEGTHTVQFIDVDGTILKSQYVADGGSATPPANPTREKCQFVKWSDPYTNITRDTDVFALYKSSDGNSWYRVKANANYRMNLTIRCDTASPVIIDWGDGSSDTATERNTYIELRHDYAEGFNGWVKVSSEGNHRLGSIDVDGNPCVIEVVVGDKVATIGPVASQMFNLRSIVIPDTVKECEGYLFCNCQSLLSLALPDGVKKISMNKALSMTDLRYVRLPKTLTEMPANMLGSSYSLQSIVIPEGVTSIGASAFQDCANLQSIVIPEGVTSIGTSAFQGCSSLQSIAIPASVTSIGDSAFQRCINLQRIVIPASVISIGKSAFQNCSKLRDVKILGSLTSIRDNEFAGCYALHGINIPEGVTSIGASAFQGCSSFQSIAIPASVTSIGANAFKGCSNAVFSVNVNNFAPTAGVFMGCRRLTGNINIIADEIPHDAFAFTGITSLFCKANKTTRTTGGGAFYGCEELTRVELTDIKEIGSYTFNACTALSLAIIGDTVTKIDSSAFLNCTTLARLVVKAATPPTLASNALKGCGNLTAIYVPDEAVEAYKAATNWIGYAAKIQPLSGFSE